ncbi:uncharacterized protein L203_105926 [Cryptococcus depauperatus CBS 7841]|uniref:Uncharacterized protein n=1 Tax=Cryptococcus depauperatus CBS 7841 TaxID=1295531 RepID=A0AAJ8JYJ5_9TREE
MVAEYRGNVGTWNLGGMGVCEHGTECGSAGQNPPHYGTIRHLLYFHLAAATIFALIAAFSSVLFHFPAAPFTKRYGTLVPLFAPMFPCIVMISDISVKHKLELLGDVRSVEGGGVFWLGIVSFPFSVVWFLLIEYNAHVKRLQEGEDELVAEDSDEKDATSKKTTKAYSHWWPWASDHTEVLDKTKDVEMAGKRQARKKNARNG